MVFGHLDDLFAYETQKIVRIRDRRLGLTYLALVVLILLYVVVFQILYLNEHFVRKDVFGTARMTIQQPTKHGCNPNDVDCTSNFNSLLDLPYCDVSPNKTDDPEFKRKCIFADQHTLMPFGMLKGEMLVPTRIDTMVEFKECNPGPQNGYTCSNEYRLPKAQDVVYVADIEKYTIMVAHSYKRSWIKGNNGNIQGWLQVCIPDVVDEKDKFRKTLKDAKTKIQGKHSCDGKLEKRPIHCITGKCSWSPKKKKKKSDDEKFLQRSHSAGKTHRHGYGDLQTALMLDEAAEAEGLHGDSDAPSPGELVKDGMFAIPDGDIFSVKKLLELSGLDLDRTFNKEGEPLREAGTVIEIEAVYSNLHPIFSSFGFMDVQYYYKISQRPMEEMKTEMYAQNQPNYPDERIIENRHGLYIVVKIGGEFGFFSVVYTLVMLTTALGLIGVAVLITDKIALYLMAQKEVYRESKYQTTERLADDHSPREQQDESTAKASDTK